MDHWGDPWADNADEPSPTKNAVTSPAPAANTSAPALLNGFLDDAGWGNDDETFGDWAASTTTDQTTSHIADSRASAKPNHFDGASTADWGSDHGYQDERALDAQADTWRRDSIGLQDKVPSDISDTSTTIPPTQDAVPEKTQLNTDEGSSARPSTSPSDVSPREQPVDSPRTSLEEDLATSSHFEEPAGVFRDNEHVSTRLEEASTTEDISVEPGITIQYSLDTDELLGSTEEAGQEKELADSGYGLDSSVHSGGKLSHIPARVSGVPEHKSIPIDASLLKELFPSQMESRDLDEAPEDPIYSTGGRKAWYRLTRKQTLREYNSGNGDDNYIRVTWASSHVRTEVHKVVSRWAREDRLSGTGAGARASFYWDTPAPVDHQIPSSHSRTKTTISAPRIVAPARQSLPPMPAGTSAAFNWSSPTSSYDPWKQGSSNHVVKALPVVSSISETVDQSSESKFADVESASKRLAPETTVQSSVVPLETSNVAKPSVSYISSATVPTTTDAWAGLSTFDINTSAPSVEAITSVNHEDDEDDWGEMVTSPTIDTVTTSEENRASPVLGLDDQLASSSQQGKSVDTMHASPVVRLRSTISPTSAIFGAKAFVPLGAEQGPIGPGLLKRTNRSISATIGQSTDTATSKSLASKLTPKTPNVMEVRVKGTDLSTPVQTHCVPIVDEAKADEFPDFASSTLSVEPVRPFTPDVSIHAPTKASTDPWSDADFLFFESGASEPGPALQGQNDPSDPFSVFGTPPRPSSSSSSAKTFTRSPPRNLTPPPIQPLTGATSSAQRRKIEEEQTIKDILRNLPNMSYMLQK